MSFDDGDLFESLPTGVEMTKVQSAKQLRDDAFGYMTRLFEEICLLNSRIERQGDGEDADVARQRILQIEAALLRFSRHAGLLLDDE